MFVFTEKKFYDTLKHGFLRIEEFDMLVFDECHHADQNHSYNLIMEHFFYFDEAKLDKMPRILGLTASPIKSKVGDTQFHNITEEIKLRLQKLADNLYSQFVVISLPLSKSMEQQISVLFSSYKFDLKKVSKQMAGLSAGLIQKLCQLIELDPTLIENKQMLINEDWHQESRERTTTMTTSEQLEVSIDLMSMQNFEREQDDQVVDFLKKRYSLMSLDLTKLKSNFYPTLVKSKDQKLLLIFIIILLKNANNIILELGMYPFLTFLE